jgi:hypothetical protein
VKYSCSNIEFNADKTNIELQLYFFIIRSNVFNYHPNVQCVWGLTEIKIGCCSGI